MFRKYTKRESQVGHMSREKRADMICHMYVDEKKSLDTIGLFVGLTRERVRQILIKQGVTRRTNKGWRIPRIEVKCARTLCDKKILRTETARYPKYCSISCGCLHRDYKRSVSPYSSKDPRYEKWRKEYACKKAHDYYHNVFKKKRNWRAIVRERNERYAQIRKINSVDKVL